MDVTKIRKQLAATRAEANRLKAELDNADPLSVVASDAIEYVRLRRYRTQLKTERNACACDKEKVNEEGIMAEDGGPCWKDYGGVTDEWCNTCKKRQDLHSQYKQAIQDCGVALRRLMRSAARSEARNDRNLSDVR